MIVRKLLFTALQIAARNPAVRRQAVKAVDKAADAARPGLLKASRRAGEAVRSASDELKRGGKKIQGWHGRRRDIAARKLFAKSPKRPQKNITPKNSVLPR